MTMSYGGRDGVSLSEPILIYRVSVVDGSEEPVRSVKLGSVSISTLRRIVGTAERQNVYNTLTASSIPSTFIVPQALLLEEFEVKKEKRDYTPKSPVVISPLSQK